MRSVVHQPPGVFSWNALVPLFSRFPRISSLACLSFSPSLLYSSPLSLDRRQDSRRRRHNKAAPASLACYLLPKRARGCAAEDDRHGIRTTVRVSSSSGGGGSRRGQVDARSADGTSPSRVGCGSATSVRKTSNGYSLFGLMCRRKGTSSSSRGRVASRT